MAENLIKNKNLIPLAIVIAGLLIAGAIFFLDQNKQNKEEETEFLTSQQAAEKAMNFINQNLLQEGTAASLVSATEQSNVYKIRINIGNQEYDSYVTKDGKLLFTQGIDLESKPETAQEEGLTIGDFSVSQDEVCKEDGKPIVYFFGANSCPHCLWEHPIFEEVAKKFEGEISFHNNMDNQSDMDVFSRYSTGGIPALVLGCKYYRVGSGEQAGKEEETKNLTALFCKLTGENPKEICEPVKDLIDQIR